MGAGGLAISAGGGVTQDVRDNAAAASMAERTTRALVEAATGLQQRPTTKECQVFRVWAGMMEKKEISHGPTQRAPHP